ncbi:MAG: DUF1249 domain-containing protein [Gammaproteobacteria bacterium]|nr:DUF1249 domain-containing protein [Gammaproteobacteria bacterium]
MIHNFKKNTVTPVGLYESNYRKVISLFPCLSNLHEQASNQTNIKNKYGNQSKRVYSNQNLTIEVLDIFKYTTIIKLIRQLPINSTKMTVDVRLRLCHDANLAEVIGFQEMDNIKKYFYYPNEEMMLVDEKKQLNFHVKTLLDIAHKGKNNN